MKQALKQTWLGIHDGDEPWAALNPLRASLDWSLRRLSSDEDGEKALKAALSLRYVGVVAFATSPEGRAMRWLGRLRETGSGLPAAVCAPQPAWLTRVAEDCAATALSASDLADWTCRIGGQLQLLDRSIERWWRVRYALTDPEVMLLELALLSGANRGNLEAVSGLSHEAVRGRVKTLLGKTGGDTFDGLVSRLLREHILLGTETQPETDQDSCVRLRVAPT